MGCLEASSDCFGREILLEPALVSVSSWPSLSSGVVRDFGVEGSEDNALMCFEEGRKILTIGFVINPNTTVLNRTTVMVLVIMTAFPSKCVCPDLEN